MDASTITKLRAKQLTQYTNRRQTMDSSTLTWMQQLQSSRVCAAQPPTARDPPPCCQGGNGRDAALTTGSTVRYPNVLAGAMGSASRIYSSDHITLQRAGATVCGLPSADGSYIQVDACDCISTNGPTPDQPNPPVNGQTNAYLPPFDTYYRFKHSPETKVDQHAQHFVPRCAKTGCVAEP